MGRAHLKARVSLYRTKEDTFENRYFLKDFLRKFKNRKTFLSKYLLNNIEYQNVSSLNRQSVTRALQRAIAFLHRIYSAGANLF